jgi:hypothetical protein
MAGLLQGDVPKEGPDGREAHIARARAVAAFLLQLSEECTDQGGVEVVQA